MKRIFLTGSTGYLGGYITKMLLAKSYEVVALVRQTSDIGFLNTLGGSLKVYRLGEVEINTIFKDHQFDIVLHTATSYGRKGEDLSSIVKSNLLLPLDILNAAIGNNVKYFINTDTALPKNLNNYSRSKKQFVEWLESFSGEINVLNIQLEYFYGPNDDPSKFITFVMNELKSGKESIDFTDATSFRDFIYIDDVVEGYLELIKQIENIKGLVTVPIGSGKALRLRDFIVEIQKITGNTNVKLNFGALPNRANEVEYSCADITYMKSIGWEPKFTFQQGIQETIKIEQN